MDFVTLSTEPEHSDFFVNLFFFSHSWHTTFFISFKLSYIFLMRFLTLNGNGHFAFFDATRGGSDATHHIWFSIELELQLKDVVLPVTGRSR